MCYNKYIEEIGGSIGAGACANIRRQNNMPRLTKETPIFRLLPGVTSHQQEEERDFLFLVIDDIVRVKLPDLNFLLYIYMLRLISTMNS